MRAHHVRIIAEIARGVRGERYLELGTWKGRCFNTVAPYFKEAIAVDIKQGCEEFIKVPHKFFCGTTDDFFKDYKSELFDLIFIDAEHALGSVITDFDNSYKNIKQNGLILLHDTYPANETRFKGCRDAYKVCDWIKSNNFKGELVTLPFYDGITIFRKCDKQLLWL
jgi:predicted O-methyltransferase YrrM